MRALSSSTIVTDPYRAGLALGESLAAIAPEVVFLFSSVHLAAPELIEGLYDALERDDLIVIGNTGDGFFETGGASDFGAAALGLNSEGRVRWQLEHIEGLELDLPAKFAQLIDRLTARGEVPCLGYLASDFRVDSRLVEPMLHKASGFPIVGGFAADANRRREKCFLYVNRRIMSDAMVVLGAYGDLRFSIAVGNSPRAVGRIGVVDASDGTRVCTVDGINAMDFVERETGKPVLQTDRGILSVLICDPAATDEKRLRSIVLDSSTVAGPLGLSGDIVNGYSVQVCLARPEDMVAEAHAVADAMAATGRTPVAALIVSCTGRKALLGPLVEHEVTAVTNAFVKDLPLAGFPSAGEIAPLRRGTGYTRNFFHNMTYVLLLIEH